jgi:inhibitor of KinA
MEFTCCPAGDRAILVQFDPVISVKINRKVIALAKCLNELRLPGIEEWVPAYASLLIYYNPLKIGYNKLVEKLTSLNIATDGSSDVETKVHELPVLYGGEWGVDLEDVARYHGMTTEDVVRIHTAPTYPVYMVGFAPGFPYLGGLDHRIHTPRLESPRIKVPAGSVGIAGQQTGIYPLDSPGGWRLIGHTPIPLFRPNHPEPVLISAGDSIRFVPITEAEYHQIKSGEEKK